MKMSYFVFGTNDMSSAVQFYDALFENKGINKMNSEGRMTLWTGDEFMFALAEPFDGEPATHGNGTMLGLSLESSEEVAFMHAKALELGGTCEGAPGIRSGRCSAYVRDLDGNKICFFE